MKHKGAAETGSAMIDDTGGGRLDLLQVVPLVTIIVLIAMISILMWLVNRNENERLRTTLISDALWVEQTLRFQLSTDEDAISRLALDGVRREISVDQLKDRIRLHLQNNPEVLRMVWFNANGQAIFSIPENPIGLSAFKPAPQIMNALSTTSHPVYSLLYKQGADLLTDISIGVNNGAGSITATVSVKTLIARQIPWWITEKYAVRLVDTDNHVLSEKARVEPASSDLTHKIIFDPPLVGTWLSISAYRVSSDFSYELLVSGILGLGLFAVFSLIILYRNALRRKAAEVRLRAEMAFRQSMEESLTVGLRARDHDGKILYVNNAFCQMTGFAADELTGRIPPMPYWLEDRIEETLARHDTLRKGGLKTQRFETRFCRKDGTELDVQVFEAPLIDANGGHRGWMGSIIDITDQTRAAEITRMQAESLQRTGRLVTLGEMASSLAHELNQPLAAIASYAAGSLNLLRDGEQSSDVIIPAIEKVAAQAARAGQIIRRIQDFVRKRDPKFVEIDLATVVGDTAAFLAADARNHDAVIDVDAEPGLAPVRADRILIEQVLINLMRNGIEAMQGNGDGARKLAVRLWSTEGRQIIDIRDHGSGIAENVAGRIFEPFVTSKADGMGMGLNICRTIVELHHGHLVFRAHPEGGTVFSIELPGPTRVEVAAE